MRRDLYWRKTQRLTIALLAVWILITFALAWYAKALNVVSLFGFPLGFYMAAQGSLIVFVILCTWSSSAQNKIDEEFGVAED